MIDNKSDGRNWSRKYYKIICVLLGMAYVKYLAFFLPPDIPAHEAERYSSLTKGITKYLGERNINPLLQLDTITEDYMLLYKYKKDPFMKRILENSGKYTPEEVVLLGYLPVFMVSINSSSKGYLLSEEYSELVTGTIISLSNGINSWNDLKRVIWERLINTNLLEGSSEVIKEMFTIITRTILLLKLRLLICLDNFIPETLELPKDVFGGLLSTYTEGPSEIRHAILTIMMVQNQTLFVTEGKDIGKRVYEDSRTVLGTSSISERFEFIPDNLHLGIIMDGNRRWGKMRNLPGHFFGTQKTEELLRWVMRIRNVDELTLYCLSIDNLEKRDKDEIENLEVLLQIYLSHLITAKDTLSEELEIVVIGEISKLSDRSQELVAKIHGIYGLSQKPRKRLNLAIAYDAIKDSERTLGNLFRVAKSDQISLAACDNEIAGNLFRVAKSDQISLAACDNEIAGNLFRVAKSDQISLAACDNENTGRLHEEVGDYKALRTPIDYVIRCGNVMRTSGFFPLQTIYAEWLFLQLLWPDMTYETLVMCLKELGDRSRRFGK